MPQRSERAVPWPRWLAVSGSTLLLAAALLWHALAGQADGSRLPRVAASLAVVVSAFVFVLAVCWPELVRWRRLR